MITLRDPSADLKESEFVGLVNQWEDGEYPPTDVLLGYVRHEDESVRRLAVELLEQSNNPAAIPNLLEATADNDIEVSSAAGKALLSFDGPSAIAYFVAGLEDSNSETRLAAVIALRDRRASEAVERLARLLDDPEPEIRREALIALARYRRSDLLPLLSSALREEARRHQDLQRALLPAVRSILRHKNPTVRKAAIRALAEFDGILIIDDLIAALADDDWQVRCEAAIAFRKFPGEATEKALLRAIGDPIWQVAREAALSLSSWQMIIADHAAELLQHEVAELRAATALTLGQSANPVWRLRLEPLLNDSDPVVREAAHHAIEQLK